MNSVLGVLRLCPPSAGSGSPEPLQGAMPGLRGARHSSFAPTFLFAGDPSVTCLLTAMTLTVTGLGTLVALSFFIYSPTLPREGGRRPLACLTRSPRPAGEADAGQTRPPARRAVGGGCTRRGADATMIEVPPAATALRNLTLPETWQGRIPASATTGTQGLSAAWEYQLTQVVFGISW
jgi:hypothetical protein